MCLHVCKSINNKLIKNKWFDWWFEEGRKERGEDKIVVNFMNIFLLPSREKRENSLISDNLREAPTIRQQFLFFFLLHVRQTFLNVFFLSKIKYKKFPFCFYGKNNKTNFIEIKIKLKVIPALWKLWQENVLVKNLIPHAGNCKFFLSEMCVFLCFGLNDNKN